MLEDYLLFIAAILYLSSALLWISGRERFSLPLLSAGSILLFLWAASLDPFLNAWDERFHALVGSNLRYHMLVPTLVDKPVFPWDKTSWFDNHIWLHKQPLFLWQIALSISIFGVHTISVRLPSVILASVMVLIVYRIGHLVFSRRVGYISALLVSTSFTIVMLVSGGLGMEHNDISFIFYVTASIWAWLEYERSAKTTWIVFMGTFAGCAILCKWLTGSLVFAIFGFCHLIKKDLFTREILSRYAKALLICAVIVIPWQIYIHLTFPVEAAFEQHYNARHFTEVVEGHSMPATYYIDLIKEHYRMMQVFIFIGMGIALLRGRKIDVVVSLIAGIVMVYVFFSIAATKMPNFVAMVMPVMLIFMAAGFDVLVSVFMWCFPKWFASFCILGMLVFIVDQNLGLSEIRKINPHDNSPLGRYWKMKKSNTESFERAAKILPAGYVFIWIPNFYETIECMFYTGHTAYGNIGKEQIQQYEHKGVKFAVFKLDSVPDYVSTDTLIYHIPYKLGIEP